jgi:hypothetical protein
MRSPFETLAECHPLLEATAAAARDDWAPDPVPVTVGLGALGNALVRNERDLPDEVLMQVAAHVEEGLAERGDERNAVATGFLEAICHRADEAPSSVERIVRHLGPRAVEYIRAWDAFTGSSTRGV